MPPRAMALPIEQKRARLFGHDRQIERIGRDDGRFRIKLDEIEGRGMMCEKILGKCSISWSYFDHMLATYLDGMGDIGERLFIDEEVLSEGFFGFYRFHTLCHSSELFLFSKSRIVHIFSSSLLAY